MATRKNPDEHRQPPRQRTADERRQARQQRTSQEVRRARLAPLPVLFFSLLEAATQARTEGDPGMAEALTEQALEVSKKMANGLTELGVSSYSRGQIIRFAKILRAEREKRERGEQT